MEEFRSGTLAGVSPALLRDLGAKTGQIGVDHKAHVVRGPILSPSLDAPDRGRFRYGQADFAGIPNGVRMHGPPEATVGKSRRHSERRFTELIRDKDPAKVKAVMEAMMKMVKLDVAELERAYNEA